MPFTLLRVGFIGIGEILLFCLFFSQLVFGVRNVFKPNFIFSRFWFIFLILNIVGLLVHALFYSFLIGTIEGAFFDLSSYFFILIAVYGIELNFNRREVDMFGLLKNFFYVASLTLSVLYIISFYVSSIFGFNLKYFEYFSPLSVNIHQTAMFIAPLPFIGLYILKKSTGYKERAFIIALIVLLTMMSLDTGSFKVYAGIVIGYILIVAILIFSVLSKNLRKLFIVLFISLVILVLIIKFDIISESLLRIFTEEDIGDGRQKLYSSALDASLKSPLFGLGPGAHIFGNNEYWDAHQTFLTVLLQTGILGLIAIILFFREIFQEFMSQISALPILVPILAYALGGDIMRRLPVWIILLIVYYTIRQTSMKEK